MTQIVREYCRFSSQMQDDIRRGVSWNEFLYQPGPVIESCRNGLKDERLDLAGR